MTSVWTKIRSIAATSMLAAVVLSPAPASADLVLPKSAWPVCDDFIVDYCIEEITIQPIGAKSGLKLEWYPSGFGPDAALPDNSKGSVEGPETLTPQQGAFFTYSAPIGLPINTFKFNYQGPGTPESEVVVDAASNTASVFLKVLAAESGTAVLEFWLDTNVDGKQDVTEFGITEVVNIGTASTVGTGADTPIAGEATKGRWSHPKWSDYNLNAFGYDGLTVDFGTANAFTNDLFFTVLPVKVSNGKVTNIAIRGDGSKAAANLNLNDRITLKVRVGEIDSDITMGIANSLSIQRVPATGKATQKLVISGGAVPVPQISNKNQCEGETGVASAVVNTMQGYIVLRNDGLGFGVDGLSGKMFVSSNGVACGLSSPVWLPDAETLNWQAGAPHFEPDGVTPNKGFYRAIIPASDALLLWGLADPKKAVTALTISVTSESGSKASVESQRISYLHGNIIIDVTGFNFSKPKIQIKKSATFGGFVKAKTLTCVDPVTKKKVTVTDAYGCPKAPEKPVQNFVTAKFAGSASTINAAQKTNVKNYLNGFIEANKFVCTGVYKTGASKSEQTLAKKRAAAICNYAKSLDKTLSYFADAKPSASKTYLGKVMVTMKDDK